MANMYPDYFPGENNPDNPEFEVFQILRGLPRNYSVLYSKKFKGGRLKEECEIDFIIFDGHRCLTCVEVKGGTIKYDGAEDVWYQNEKLLPRAPDRQASSAMRGVVEFLGTDAGNLNMGWALCFPNCCLPEPFQPPAAVPKDIILDQESLLHLDEAVSRVEAYYTRQFGRRGLTGTSSKQLVAKLTRGIGFLTKLGVQIASDYRQILEVTNEQFGVLEDLAVNPRVVVRGYAGSGKTLVAQEFAKRLARADQTVLLLFYNHMIEETVRHGLGQWPQIHCTTFHHMARRLIGLEDPGWWQANKSSSETFWEDAVPLKLLELPSQAIATYDAVIVDEGQDFKRDWYDFLESLLQDKERGHFVVFYDENQDIFGRWDDLPWGARGTTRKVLTRNCRNTKAIADYIKRYYPCDMMPCERSPSGVNVIERTVADAGEARRWLLRDLQSVLDQGVGADQIILLVNKDKKASCLADVQRLGNCSLEWIGRSHDASPGVIRYTHIATFKGLEADVVFVLDCADMTEKEYASAVYVQGSRARAVLYLYRPRSFKSASAS